MKWVRRLGFLVVYLGIAVGVPVFFAYILDLRLEVATLLSTLFIVFVWIPLANRVGSLFGVTPMPPDDPASVRPIPIAQVHEHLLTRRRYCVTAIASSKAGAKKSEHLRVPLRHEREGL